MDTEFDRVMSGGYLGDLTRRPIAVIRTMREECQRIETALSYVRRMVQGRLDVVLAESRRRQAGDEPTDLAALVAQLPRILADRTRAPGPGRLSQVLAPGKLEGEFVRRLDAIVSQGHLHQLNDLSDAELERVRVELDDLERAVSARRRDVFGRVDAVQAELTRRYRTGEASVESLLT